MFTFKMDRSFSLVIAALVTALGLSACSTDPEETNDRSSTNGSDASGDQTNISVEMDVIDGSGFSLAGSNIDFKLQVQCKLNGAPLTPVFTQTDLLQGNASLPQAAVDCIAFPIDITMNLAQGDTTFNPNPANQITPNSFLKFKASAAATETYVQSAPTPTPDVTSELKVNLDQALPAVILNVPAAPVKFTVIVLQKAAEQTLATTILLNQTKVSSTIAGFNPPALAVPTTGFLASAASQPAATNRCAVVVQLKCSRDPVQAAGKMTSCDGALLSTLVYSFEQPGVTTKVDELNAANVIASADSVQIPLEVACNRAGSKTTETMAGLKLTVTKKVAAVDSGSIAFGFALTINYKP